MTGDLWLSRIFIVAAALLTIQVASGHPRSQVIHIEVGPQRRNCRDVQTEGNNDSGVYTIFPYNCCPERPLKVYCDMETDGGGWTVIQRRDTIDPREDFLRTWMEYALGFGNLKGEFWLGNDHIHALTDQTFNEIRFDLTDFEGNTRWAIYNFFYVHDRSLFYKVRVAGYSGDAGDGFTSTNRKKFTTKDKDLDNYAKNCAESFKGAWWYDACHSSNLNGFQYSGSHESYADGINWVPWLGAYYSLKKTEMKIRPAY